MTVPGWYQDPSDSASLRWFDGVAWSNHQRPLSPGPQAQAGVSAEVSLAPQPDRNVAAPLSVAPAQGVSTSKVWIGALAAGITVLVVASLVGAVALLGGGGSAQKMTAAGLSTDSGGKSTTSLDSSNGSASEVEGPTPPSEPAAPTTQATTPPPLPVTEAEMKSLLLPDEVCDGLEFPPGGHQLVDGQFAPGTGYFVDNAIVSGPVALGDLDGDAVADGVIGLGCSTGTGTHIGFAIGVRAVDRTHFDVHLIADQNGIDSNDARAENMNDLESMEVVDGSLKVHMWWLYPGDPHCCPTTVARALYRFDGVALQRTELSVVDDAARTTRLVSALNAGDAATVNSLLEPQSKGTYDSLMARQAQFTSRGCRTQDYRFCEFTENSEGGMPFVAYWNQGASDRPQSTQDDWGVASSGEFAD